MTSCQLSCIPVVLGLAPALAACDTVEGIGRDLQTPAPSPPPSNP
jgi:predicted small secreted protein